MAPTEPHSGPRGERVYVLRALPKDTNASGDIFGGWLMSQMDLAGGVPAEFRARGRVATVAVQTMVFHQPVKVGDLVACYAEILKIGTTSMTVLVEAWVQHWDEGRERKVTEGVFTYVALDDNGEKRPIPPE